MLPYANRIKNGRFRFAGIDYRLPLNFGDHPHSIHGVGWQSVWRLVRQEDQLVELALDYRGDGWPFPFRARQTFSLQGGELLHALDITNLADQPMPAGMGMHPYFPRHRGARLQADITHVWLIDDTCIPVERVPCPGRWNLGAGADVDALQCDNQFEPWTGRACISWPDDGMSAELTASEDLNRLGVYAPEGQDFVCVEPISHITDAFNRTADGGPPAETGMRVLEPGETWGVWLRLSPRPD